MTFPETMGALGVALLLVAYLINVMKWADSKSFFYLILNTIGAALACYSSWLISFIPFVVLEGVWALVSLFSLVRLFSGKKN